jgi:hypothetical protein
LQGEGNAKTVKKETKKAPKSLGQAKQKAANIDALIPKVFRTGLRSQGSKQLVAGL